MAKFFERFQENYEKLCLFMLEVQALTGFRYSNYFLKFLPKYTDQDGDDIVWNFLSNLLCKYLKIENVEYGKKKS